MWGGGSQPEKHSMGHYIMIECPFYSFINLINVFIKAFFTQRKYGDRKK
jgi:hypothetical protein